MKSRNPAAAVVTLSALDDVCIGFSPSMPPASSTSAKFVPPYSTARHTQAPSLLNVFSASVAMEETSAPHLATSVTLSHSGTNPDSPAFRPFSEFSYHPRNTYPERVGTPSSPYVSPGSYSREVPSNVPPFALKLTVMRSGAGTHSKSLRYSGSDHQTGHSTTLSSSPYNETE